MVLNVISDHGIEFRLTLGFGQLTTPIPVVKFSRYDNLV